MNYQPPPQPQYSAPSTQQPAAICALKSPADAIHILEAVRLGLVPRVTRRLTGHERTMIRPGTVWVWEEEETNMKRWTDGRRWGASRVGGGGFLVYTESSENHSPPPNRSDSPLYPHNYSNGSRRSESLIKQTYSTNMTQPGSGKQKRFHVVAYSSKHNPQGDGHSPLPLPRDLPLLANIRVQAGIWPEWEHRVASENTAAATRKTDSPTAGSSLNNSTSGRPVSNPSYPYARRSPPRQFDGYPERGRSPPPANVGQANWAQRDGKPVYPPGPQYAGYDHYQQYPPRHRVPSYPGNMPYTPPGTAPGQQMYDASRDRGAYNGMPVSAPPTGVSQYNSTPYSQYPTMQSREDEEKYRRAAPMSAGTGAVQLGSGVGQLDGGVGGGRDKSPKMGNGFNILNTNNGDAGLTLPPLRMADERGKMGSPVDGTGRKVGV